MLPKSMPNIKAGQIWRRKNHPEQTITILWVGSSGFCDIVENPRNELTTRADRVGALDRSVIEDYYTLVTNPVKLWNEINDL
jgi:hypothetical protein